MWRVVLFQVGVSVSLEHTGLDAGIHRREPIQADLSFHGYLENLGTIDWQRTETLLP